MYNCKNLQIHISCNLDSNVGLYLINVLTEHDEHSGGQSYCIAESKMLASPCHTLDSLSGNIVNCQ